MKAIGGYFELELRKGEHYYPNAIRLNTARNCFEYVLTARKYKKVYIPYYTCEVMLQPIMKLGISYEFYSINKRLEPVEAKILNSDEAFLYTNYFGLKQDCVERLAQYYGVQLIVDNSQAFYAPRVNGIDTFYSARKFFGVPDGAYLYTDYTLDIEFKKDVSIGRMQHLLQRIDEGAEAGYLSFRQNDDALDYTSIMKMSNLTSRILESIDYTFIKNKRIENFIFLHKHLKEYNLFDFLPEDTPALVYPFYTLDYTLKTRLLENKIFVATYWPNVFDWCNKDMLEYNLATNVISIPIDQRYDNKDFITILKICCKDEKNQRFGFSCRR